MLGLILLAIFALIIIRYQPSSKRISDIPARLADKLDQLWLIVHESIKDQKYLRAEKALLTILHIDHKNASAYNRLGIIYARQKSLNDAIECFEIAQSLEPSVSSLHNVGLIYYETGNYEKASLAFEQALEIDDSLATRHIAYAKVQEKIGAAKKMIAALEKAVELEPTAQNYNILADAYEHNDQPEMAIEARDKAIRLNQKQVDTQTKPVNDVKKPRFKLNIPRRKPKNIIQ